MELKQGTIIHFQEAQGYKRSLYGIVMEQLNTDSINIFSEISSEGIVTRFLNSDASSHYINIYEVLNSYKDIPSPYGSSKSRLYFKKLAKLSNDSPKSLFKDFIDLLDDYNY